MLVEMLAMGVLFWIILICGIIGLAILVEVDRVGWAGAFSIVLLGIFMFILPDFSYQSIIDNGGVITMNVVYYLMLGTGWSFIKWYMMLKSRKNEYFEHRAVYLEMNGISEIGTSSSDKEAFRKFLEKARFLSEYNDNNKTIQPLARYYKDRITGWIFWWPISIILSLFRDVATWIYDHIKGVFQVLSDRMFKGVKEEI